MNSLLVRCLVLAPLLLSVASPCLRADPSEPIALWPKGAPGDTGNLGEEHDTTSEKDGKVAGKPVMRIGNVSNPTITYYRPPKDRDTGAAVVVCPGGAYHILALDLEGTEVCEWLNSIGVTGVLLKYRVPARAGRERYAAPLQDAQRALGLVRAQAKLRKIDPKRIGILGFSAGGHLAAAAATNYEKRTYDVMDDADAESCRPDFVVLIYPAYLTLQDEHDTVAPELAVNRRTPPTFLTQTEDDGVGVWCVMTYARALQKAKVPCELHVYPTGGHGYGLRRTGKAVADWPQRAGEWLRAMGILETNQGGPVKVEAVLGPAEFGGLARRDLGGTVSVVFDILRATTTMITALENGAGAVRPVREITEALAWREREPEVLLGGERDGLRILAAQTGSVDFDFGNSPREVTPERVAGRTIVMTTTNGTRALAACAHSARVFPASFPNLEATMSVLAKLHPERLLLVCAGTLEEPAYEDILAAGAACERLICGGVEIELGDAAAAAWQAFQVTCGDLFGAMRFSKNARRLLSQPDLEGDVPVCLRQNVSRMVAEMQSGLVKPVVGEAPG